MFSCIIFMKSDLFCSVVFESGRTMNTNWYMDHCLPVVYITVSKRRLSSVIRDLIVHDDNALSQSAWITDALCVRTMPNHTQTLHTLQIWVCVTFSVSNPEKRTAWSSILRRQRNARRIGSSYSKIDWKWLQQLLDRLFQPNRKVHRYSGFIPRKKWTKSRLAKLFWTMDEVSFSVFHVSIGTRFLCTSTVKIGHKRAKNG
jgi:hypothetical protein